MAELKSLTRKQLSKLYPNDPDAVRSIESLFKVAGDLTPSEIAELTASIDALQQAHNGFGANGVATIRTDLRTLLSGDIVFVSDKYDFPLAGSGVIALPDNTTYFITGTVDLDGDRLDCGANISIIGSGPEISKITSTGLDSATALITSVTSLVLNSVEVFDVGTAFDLDASATSDQAIDWFAVNLVNIPTIGTIKSYGNAIFLLLGIIGSANLTFDGTIGTIGFGDTIFIGIAGENTLIFPSTLTISRRFRTKFSAFVTPAGGTAIDFDVSASVPLESYILFECNFSGSGVNISGVQHDDVKSRFTGNDGINNSTQQANYYMAANATVTTITTASTPVKIAGTTTENPITERFTHSDNKVVYDGGLPRIFNIHVNSSMSSSSSNILNLYAAKNGTVVSAPYGAGTANSGGRVENISLSFVVEMETDDYIEIFCSNETGANDITVENLNVIVSEL